MSDERARLFVALELPDAASRALVGWRKTALSSRAELRPVAAVALHLTLCFLGWRAVDEIAAIGTACEVVAGTPAVELSLADPLWLPPRRPRVLAVKLADPGHALASLQSTLAQALRAGGWYAPEPRPFLAHVTVARVPRGARAGRDALPAPAPVGLTASTVTLYRSRPVPGGARYERLSSVELGASPPVTPNGSL